MNFDGSESAAPAAAEEVVIPDKEVSAPAAVASAPTSAPAIVIEAATPVNTRIFASPVARRLAMEKGIDLSFVPGTGPNGRITKEDVEAFKKVEAAPPPPHRPDVKI